LSRQQDLLEMMEMREDGRLRLCLRGELDLAGVPTLTERLQGLRERRETVLIDLEELSFVDASGLRALLLALERAADDGLSFTVTPGSPAVRRLIGLVGVDGQLPLDGGTT
jgi:anti-anti-sigma factor